MLLHFPEQVGPMALYRMEPGINSGWTKVADSDRTAYGVVQNTSGDRIKDRNGNLVKSSGLEFWTEEADLDGYFYTSPGGAVYRLVGSNNWVPQGAFCRYSLEKVVGANGSQSDNITWNTGYNSFG